jgi:LacI family transcriptional regulator
MTANRKRRSSTMNDVAQLAGVSQTTVSFVVNDSQSVTIAAETKARVWEAVKQLGYRPNAMAQGLRTQRSNTIGFITDEIAITPHAGRIIEGAQDTAWENGKILLLVNTKRNPDMERTAAEMLLERQVEGIITPPCTITRLNCLHRCAMCQPCCWIVSSRIARCLR